MAKKKKKQKEDTSHQEKEKLSILIVDDDESFRILAQEILKNKYRLDCAPNGKIGVEKTIANHYDIILMDLQMPEMDGIDAIHKIWEVKPNQLIIIVSAMVYDTDFINRSKKVKNIFDVINKPFDNEEFLFVIENAEKIIREKNI